MQGIHEAELVEVIRIVETIGTGTEGNAVRRVTSYWTADGKLIAREDPDLSGVVENFAVRRGPEILAQYE